MRKHLVTLLKILVSVGGLAYVLWRFDLSQIATALADVNWLWLVPGFILVVIGLFLRAFRWLVLIRGLGPGVPFGRLVELYFVGNFFNAFLPSGFGGDVVRVIEIAQDVPADVGAGTVIVDRLTGLMTLFAMGLAALLLAPADFPRQYFWFLAIAATVGLIGGVVLLEGGLIRRFGGWLPGPLSPNGDGPVARLLKAVQGCGWTAVAKAMGVSLVFNLVLVGYWWTSGQAVGAPHGFSYYLLAVPVMSLALLLPSVGGLGVRETLAPSLFAGPLVTPEQAITISLLVFLLMRLSSLLGAPVYFMSALRDARAATG